MPKILIKRIYDDPASEDGWRVLVDRLWPRGISKERAALDLWDKDVAPSSSLRKWFNHEEKNFAEFTERYRAELEASDAVPQFVAQLRDHPVVTLLYAARDPQINHVVVLRDYLVEALDA